MSKLPPLEHFEVVEPKKPHRISWRVWLPVALILAFFIVRAIPRVREMPGIRCSDNLRQIGQAIQLYAQDNHGLFPPDLQALAGSQPIDLSAFHCPSAPDERPPTTASIGDPGRCSYIYVGAGLTSKANPKCILALDDPANHGLKGSNVLFANGHGKLLEVPTVKFLDLPTIQLILNQLNAGHNPPSTLTPPSPKPPPKKTTRPTGDLACPNSNPVSGTSPPPSPPPSINSSHLPIFHPRRR